MYCFGEGVHVSAGDDALIINHKFFPLLGGWSISEWISAGKRRNGWNVVRRAIGEAEVEDPI